MQAGILLICLPLFSLFLINYFYLFQEKDTCPPDRTLFLECPLWLSNSKMWTVRGPEQEKKERKSASTSTRYMPLDYIHALPTPAPPNAQRPRQTCTSFRGSLWGLNEIMSSKCPVCLLAKSGSQYVASVLTGMDEGKGALESHSPETESCLCLVPAMWP